MPSAIGNRIREARRAKGLSQAQLAAMIGEKNTTISNWEVGVSKPDIDALCELSKALEVSANDLLMADGDKPAITDAAAHFDANKLTPEGREQYLNFIAYLAERFMKVED